MLLVDGRHHDVIGAVAERDRLGEAAFGGDRGFVAAGADRTAANARSG